MAKKYVYLSVPYASSRSVSICSAYLGRICGVASSIVKMNWSFVALMVAETKSTALLVSDFDWLSKFGENEQAQNFEI
jgi:hypothetical protein